MILQIISMNMLTLLSGGFRVSGLAWIFFLIYSHLHMSVGEEAVQHL